MIVECSDGPYIYTKWIQQDKSEINHQNSYGGAVQQNFTQLLDVFHDRPAMLRNSDVNGAMAHVVVYKNIS